MFQCRPGLTNTTSGFPNGSNHSAEITANCCTSIQRTTSLLTDPLSPPLFQNRFICSITDCRDEGNPKHHHQLKGSMGGASRERESVNTARPVSEATQNQELFVQYFDNAKRLCSIKLLTNTLAHMLSQVQAPKPKPRDHSDSPTADAICLMKHHHNGAP